MRLHHGSTLGLVFILSACGSPAPAPAPTAAPSPAPPAAAGVAAAAPAVMDPKGTIDTARAAAGAASAATTARANVAEAPKPAAAPNTSTPAGATASAATALATSGSKYDAQGRRDPFESLEARLGSERSTVSTAKLTGVIRGPANAVALVETPDGIGYILKPGDTLADGRVTEIGSNTVVFQIAPRPGAPSNRVVLKLTE